MIQLEIDVHSYLAKILTPTIFLIFLIAFVGVPLLKKILDKIG